ncbi:MAG: CehA/McbA family metallohydrolase [Candidatus Hadarchaeum sp.]|uniref:CehA/McbA family metallohydrolase n=1 Tax=Candidatus Hadarchaeum sp. TaxID=2883567 RepID=UPI003D09F92D
MLRLDLHVHTKYSYDCRCPVERAVEIAKTKGLNGIAITDHDSISGHRAAKKMSKNGFVVLPGVEISSAQGHIVGLGIEESIPKGLPAADTVELIREQGGIAIAAHPFAPGRRPELVYKAKFDAIEGLNSRAILLSNPLAQRFAQKNGLAMVAGSDAHRCDDVGMAYTIVDCEPNPDSILEKIKEGGTSIAGRTIPLPSFMWRVLQKALQRRDER